MCMNPDNRYQAGESFGPPGCLVTVFYYVQLQDVSGPGHTDRYQEPSCLNIGAGLTISIRK